MTGKVEIINLALARIGEGAIQSLTERSATADKALAFYDSARRAVLRAYNWAFALRVETLARREGSPADFRFAYALPADCLRAIRLRESGVSDFSRRTGPRFAVRGNTLYTDVSSALLEYVADVADETRFDARFLEAFSYKLAADLAMPVAGSQELMASYMNAYQALVTEAAASSASEQKDELPENPYLEARNAGC